MKVICISNHSISTLTIGKTYELVQDPFESTQGQLYYLIFDDCGWKGFIGSDNFITVQENRNNKLKEIL